MAGARSPYPGEGGYSQEHETVFFGRRRALTSLLAMVRMSATPQQPADIMVLTGASGVGKSALLRAGLIPALRSEAGQWAVAYTTPSRDPLRSLAYAFGSGSDCTTETLVQSAEFGIPGHQDHMPAGLDPAAIRRWSGDRRVLLIVDQFEDLYDPDIEPAVREAFLTQLERLSGVGSVLISVRSDALGYCTHYSWLLNAVQHSSFALNPMQRQEMVAVITGPARAQGVTVDPGVVELVVTALEQGRHTIDRPVANPGNLPLLFATMRSLWSAYTGDRDGVLSRRAPIADLRRVADRSTAGRTILERLVRARLICLEPRHAALFHDSLLQWDRLRGWIAENRSMLLWRQRIKDDAAEWDSAGGDPGLLYRSIRLTTTINDADPMLSPVTTEFLRASARVELGTPAMPADYDYQEAVGQ